MFELPPVGMMPLTILITFITQVSECEHAIQASMRASVARVCNCLHRVLASTQLLQADFFTDISNAR
jgi:hypothetical protein